MNVLLVYPEYPATFWSFKHALKFIDKKVSLPPLGLLTVSSLLPPSFNRRLVDCNAESLKNSDLDWADWVFVSGMIVQKKSAAEIIERAKAMGKTVVAGGPLFTTGHRDFPQVDHFVLNEGEVTIPRFLADLASGNLQRVYTSDEKPDITRSPVPDWSLIRMDDYASMAVQISRGCPFNCEFCDIIVINGRVPRVKSPGQVLSEFDALYRSGWRGNVFVVDDNFIGNKAKVRTILERIGEWMKAHGQPFMLYTEASINLADDPGIMTLMQRANFNSVFVGIETPEEEGLRACGKMQNVNKDLKEKVKILQRNGLEVQAGFIVGFDTDSPRTFDNMIRFIQQSGVVTAMVGILNALPGTALFKRLQAAGRILNEPSNGNNTDLTLNFVPSMNKEMLIEGYKRVLTSIFAPRNYNRRIVTYLSEYRRTSRRPRQKHDLRDQLRALGRVIWKLGIREKGKLHFWRLCLWTTLRHPTLLPDALRLSVFGFHYRRVLQMAEAGPGNGS